MASLAQRTMLQYSDSALLRDTKLCVDDQVAKVCGPTRKHPPVERFAFGQPAASASDSPSIFTKLSSFRSGNSHTTRGVWSKYRSLASECNVGSVCCQLCLSCCHVVVGILPVRLQFLVVAWRSRLGAACARLWTRRLESKLCRCQFCVSRVSFPRQSRVAVRQTS